MSDGKYSQIIHEYLKFFSLSYFSNNFFSFWVLYIISFEKTTWQINHSEIYAHSLYIFLIKVNYLWVLWNIFVKKNVICQITILANRKHIHEIKLWQIGIGIYLWPKYQRIDSWWIYSRTICELYANREIFAEHWGSMFMYCLPWNSEWLKLKSLYQHNRRFLFYLTALTAPLYLYVPYSEQTRSRIGAALSSHAAMIIHQLYHDHYTLYTQKL